MWNVGTSWGVRTAKVILASKVSSKLSADDPTERTAKSIVASITTWEELKELREIPCCRGCACGKHPSSHRLIEVVSPLMETKNLPKKLSSYFETCQ